MYSIKTDEMNKLNNNMFVKSGDDTEYEYFKYLINKYDLVNKVDYLLVE